VRPEERTAVEELDGAQGDAQQQSVRGPLALDNGGAHDEEAEGDVDPVNVLARKQ